MQTSVAVAQQKKEAPSCQWQQGKDAVCRAICPGFVQSHSTVVVPWSQAPWTLQPFLSLAVAAARAAFASWPSTRCYECQAKGVINGKQAAF